MTIDDGSNLFAMEIETGGEFTLLINRVTDGGWLGMNRQELMALRSICDRALNTSAEELGDELA